MEKKLILSIQCLLISDNVDTRNYFYDVNTGLNVHEDPVQLAYAGNQLTLILSGLDMMHLG